MTHCVASYTVGLPVTIDVHADGSVTFEVHLEDADDLFDGAPIDESAPNGVLVSLYTDEEIERDQKVVSAASATINHTFKTTTNPTA
jgi:hypothetical protein